MNTVKKIGTVEEAIILVMVRGIRMASTVTPRTTLMSAGVMNLMASGSPKQMETKINAG